MTNQSMSTDYIDQSQRVDESYMTSGGTGRDMGSRTMLIDLNVGDTLSLYCSSCYEVLFTNICVWSHDVW